MEQQTAKIPNGSRDECWEKDVTEVPKGMVRVLPSCRQLVRPLSTEKQLTSGYTSIDTQADQQQSHFSETGQTHPQVLPTTELHSNPIVDSETPSNQTFTQEANA